MNLRQEELAYQLFEEIKSEFPEIELLDIVDMPNGDVLIHIQIFDHDIWKIIEIANKREMDILMKYGYNISLYPVCMKWEKERNGILIKRAETPMEVKKWELAQQLFEEIKRQFPHIELLRMTRMDNGAIWIKVASPYDDGCEIGEFGAEKGMDILLEYGYVIQVMPVDNIQNVESYKQEMEQ